MRPSKKAPPGMATGSVEARIGPVIEFDRRLIEIVAAEVFPNRPLYISSLINPTPESWGVKDCPIGWFC